MKSLGRNIASLMLQTFRVSYEVETAIVST